MIAALIALPILFAISTICLFVVAQSAIKAVAEAAIRESGVNKATLSMLHKSAQTAAFNATVTKNERLEAAYIELEGERIRFGAPAPAVPASNYYNPNEITSSDLQGDELRTVGASGTGVD